MKKFIIFMTLNLLDSLTTFVGVKNGLGEANAFINFMFNKSVIFGLSIKMLLAFALGFFVFKKHSNLFKPLNIAFIIIVGLNVLSLLSLK